MAALGLSPLARALSATRDLFVPPASAADGFRPLFDGKSLDGWREHPRGLNRPSLGLWTVQDGVIVSGQSKVTFGAFLVTDETFQDFELEFESRTDYETDTGVYLRTNAQVNVGYEVCIDYHLHGAINGYFGNAVGGFHACDYCFMPRKDAWGILLNFSLKSLPIRPMSCIMFRLDYVPHAQRFMAAWSLQGWNR